MKSYSSVDYLVRDEIGYFPELVNYIRHGFSWGKHSKNMDFSRGDKAEVKDNIREFLGKITETKLFETININVEHKDKILFIDENEYKTIKPSPLGKVLKGDCCFTNYPPVCLTLKPGDCTTAIVYVESEKKGRITGIIHTGRRGVELMLPQKAIKYLTEVLGCNLKEIKIGIVPHLFQMNRKFEHLKDLDTKLWEKHMIQKDGYYFPGETEFAVDQYLSTGIPEDNLSVYNVDTYASAVSNESFSYKYHLDNKEKGVVVRDGRFIVATQLL